MTASRIFYFLNSPVRAGVEEHVLSLIMGLDPSRYAIALCCPRRLLEALAPDLASRPIACYPIEATSWTRVGEIARLAGALRQFRPDIVHTHLFRATLVAAPLAKAVGVPVVIETYHGREAWRQGSLKGSFVVDRLVSRHVDAIIAVSEAAARFLLEAKRLPPAKVRVIPNGRELGAYTVVSGRGDELRRELGVPEGAVAVGVVGRLEVQKGHRFLLDALPRVVDKFPDFRVVIIGDGSLRDELQRQAATTVPNHVIFTGFRDDVAGLIAALDLIVLPSLYEGMPLVAIEAAAAGKPIVATSVDGTPEVVQHRITGLLVPPSDPQALGEAMLELLNDADLRARLGAAAWRVARERFDLRQQLAATEALYQSARRGRP